MTEKKVGQIRILFNYKDFRNRIDTCKVMHVLCKRPILSLRGNFYTYAIALEI